MGKWKEKREFMYITIDFDDEFNIRTNKLGEIIRKSVLIFKRRSGIDQQEQLLSYYSAKENRSEGIKNF